MDSHVKVNVRLNPADVAQVKAWAKARGWYWHELLRELVHGAVERERGLQRELRPAPKVK